MIPPLARSASRPPRTVPAALAVALLLAGCSSGTGPSAALDGPRARSTAGSPQPSPQPSPVPAATAAAGTAPPTARPVAALAQRRDPHVLVAAKDPLPAPVRARLVRLSDAAGTVFYRAGTVLLAGRPVQAVGVDPSSFRAFTAGGTAESDAVWQAVARGEAVVGHEAAEQRGLVLGADVTLAGDPSVPATVRLGAFATTGVPGADLVLDADLARRLGLPEASAALLTAPAGQDPVRFAGQVREVAGAAAVDLLVVPDPVARLTGGGAAEELGAFSYRYFADGTIEPDARWVRDHIRTEPVPIMGRVTCHRRMLPQLRGALQEVADAGLAGTLRTFDGCYVPRFIERNPSRSISLHTWGIAIDMDASTNYRGIRGTMDPRVVEIFKRWGFRWGGDWTYTDPMHFELGTLLTVPAD